MMDYEIVLPSESVESEFEKELNKLPKEYQKRIIFLIRLLSKDPRPAGKRHKKLKGEVIVFSFAAQHRLRIGKYRILYDIDDENKKIVLLKLDKRDEGTYK